METSLCALLFAMETCPVHARDAKGMPVTVKKP